MHKRLLIFVFCTTSSVAAESIFTEPHETWQISEKSQLIDSVHKPASTQKSAKHTAKIGVFTSQQVNITAGGANILNDAANEPSIAVNPLNPKQIVIGWRQFDTTNSGFRQAGLAYSHDGGNTWNNIGPLEPGVFRSDPVLAADANGVFYYQSLIVEPRGNPGLNDDLFRVDQWRSVDGGVSWIDKTNALGGDKSWFAIDQTESDNQGNFYAAWNLAGNEFFPNSFNYSVDNGMTFSAAQLLPDSPIFGTVAVGFDSEVYVVGMNGNTNPSDLKLIRSNNPMSVMFPDFSQVTNINLGGTFVVGVPNTVNPAGLVGQIWVATDKSNRHTRGRVYVASSVDRFGGDPLDLTFIRSLDGGITFSTPKLINDDNSFIDFQWFGTLGVAPNGRIDLVWLDTRNTGVSIQTKTHSELFYSYSYDGGVTFSTNQAIAPSFNHFLGYPNESRKLGDYIDIVSDDSGAHVAFSATYTGGQDVYYIHAKPAAVIENPYFPSHEMDGAWINTAVPRQGIISKTLVTNIDSDSPEVTHFEAIFTEDLDGSPTWMVLQKSQQLEGDSMEFVAMYPTGDLSAQGVALRPIGLVRKSRMYDDAGELIKNQLHYEFNMTSQVMEQVASMTTPASAYDADFYQSSPFFGATKQVSLTPVIAPEQSRQVHCNVHNLAWQNPEEPSEGRMPVAYRPGFDAVLFVADFTYQKTVDSEGNQTLVTSTDGLAIPTWQVMDSTSGSILNDSPLTNNIYKPNGGNGFFNETDDDPGVTLIGEETLRTQGALEISSENSNGSVEQFNPIAWNGYCGSAIE